MKVSIIVPLYFGEKYIEKIVSMVQENCNHLQKEDDVELIFVKDSLESYKRDINTFKASFPIMFLQNERNNGIHYTRARGIQASRGQFVLMLDQDDEIKQDFLVSQLEKIKDADLVVGNGIKEYPEYNKCLYKYRWMQNTVKYRWLYERFSCRILSPGQCLIRRASIPEIWMRNPLRNSGADDLFLWLLMFENKAKIKINAKLIYVHKHTASNLSLDEDKMQKSLAEMIHICRRLQCIKVSALDNIAKNQLEDKNFCRNFIVKIIERMNRTKE